ncbi:universal stress protein [Spirosoma aerolatum]|uniref:universal stress protein n=1 Tax=Spirosoma aerolatum TaxID=1211326 RepID=UPI0009AC8645|nr:universal stress protein [Spirosoma aerolatum]
MDEHSLATILTFIDFTESSLNALSVASRLCQQHEAQLRLVYVLKADYGQHPQPSVTNTSIEYLLREGADLIQLLATQTAQSFQIHCTSACRLGNKSDEIVTEASSVKADLIIMGTQTGSDMQSYRMNNDAYLVVESAHCPVLTVPDRKQWATFERILFPVRPIPGALDKYEFARRIIRKNKASLTVLALSAPEEVISIRDLQDILTELTTRLDDDQVVNQTLFCATDLMAATVLKKAQEIKTDLIIITAQLITTMDDLLIGPFTQQMIHNAQVPVLSIRSEADHYQAGELSRI